MKRFGLFFFTSVLVVSMVMLFSFPAVSSAASMASATKLYEQRADVEKAKQAISEFQKVIENEPKNEKAYELLCKTGIFLIGMLGAKEETQMDAFEYMATLSDVCDAWLELAPNSVGPNFWKAYTAAASKDINTALTYGKKAIKIDSSYMNGMPFAMMGYLKGKLPPFLGGDKVESYKLMDKAMEAQPDFLIIHRIKAALLLDDIKAASQKALVHLQFVLEADPTKGWEPEGKTDKIQAKELMDKYGEAMKALTK